MTVTDEQFSNLVKLDVLSMARLTLDDCREGRDVTPKTIASLLEALLFGSTEALPVDEYRNGVLQINDGEPWTLWWLINDAPPESVRREPREPWRIVEDSTKVLGTFPAEQRAHFFAEPVIVMPRGNPSSYFRIETPRGEAVPFRALGRRVDRAYVEAFGPARTRRGAW